MNTIKLKLALACVGLTSLMTAQGLLNNLSACYPLDCDNAVNAAATGAALNGAISNVTCATGHNGVPATAYKFFGVPSSHIKLPNDYRIKADTMSFSAWINLADTTTDKYIVFAHNTCTSYHEGYALLAANSGSGHKLSLVKANGSCSAAGQQVLWGVTTLNPNTWYHVGFYLSNGTMEIYLNGALESSAATSIAFNYSATDAVYLGGTALAFNRPFKGIMDNVRFWNRQVVASEFNVLYVMDPPCNHSGLVGLLNGLEGCYPFNCDSVNYAPTAIFPPSLDGTPFNLDCDTGHTGVPATAYKYKGLTSSYMELPNDSRLKPNAISFSGWVKLDAVNSLQYIAFTKNTCTSYFEGYALVAMDAGGGQYRFCVGKSDASCSPGGAITIYGSTLFNSAACASTWNHVAFTMDANGMELFVNGVSDGIDNTAQAINYDANWNVYLGVSNAWWFNYPLDGSIDNVRFYSRVLTPNEISILYNDDPDCDQTWCADPTDPNCRRYLPRPANPTGIASTTSEKQNVLVYPNPSTGKIIVHTPENCSFVVYDLNGKLIDCSKARLDDGNSEVTIGADGIYLIKIIDQKGSPVDSRKVVIIR